MEVEMGHPMSIGASQLRVPETHAAFASWVEPHLHVLSAVASREVGLHDAPDMVQEALIRAWRRRETYRQDLGEPRTWLVAIVLDQCRRHRRRQRWQLAQRSVDLPVFTNDDHRLDIERAVRKLPSRQRQVVVLHYLGDLAIPQVAVILGIAPSSVKSHLHAARKTLRSALEAS
jgi:RNA polymerase sigma factor (sigma-70 family)